MSRKFDYKRFSSDVTRYAHESSLKRFLAL